LYDFALFIFMGGIACMLDYSKVDSDVLCLALETLCTNKNERWRGGDGRLLHAKFTLICTGVGHGTLKTNFNKIYKRYVITTKSIRICRICWFYAINLVNFT